VVESSVAFRFLKAARPRTREVIMENIVIDIEFLEEEWSEEDVSFCTTTNSSHCAEVTE